MLQRAGSHPNIVELRDYFYSPWVCITVTNFVDFNLWQVVSEVSASNGIRSEPHLHILRALCAGVGHLHHKFILHRDLHAKNILIGVGNGFVESNVIQQEHITSVRVCDFGRAADIFGDNENGVARGLNTCPMYVSAPEIFLQPTGAKEALINSLINEFID